MGFLDKMKDAAQSAKDKVSDATGIDTDKAWESASSAYEAGEKLNDAQNSWEEAQRRH